MKFMKKNGDAPAGKGGRFSRATSSAPEDDAEGNETVPVKKGFSFSFGKKRVVIENQSDDDRDEGEAVQEVEGDMMGEADAPSKKKRFAFSFGRKKSAASEPETSEPEAQEETEADAGPEAEPADKPAKKKGLSFSFGKKASGAASPKKQKQKKASKRTSPLTGDIGTAGDGAIFIGKTKFAVGIYWISPDENLKPKAQIKAINEANENDANSRAPKYQLFVDPKKTGFLGLASTDLGHASGMRVLITTFPTDEVGNRWIGVFKTDPTNDIWWIGAVRDGKIFEDLMVKGRAKAQEVFLNELQAPDWQSIYAPDDWGVPNTKNDTLESLVNPKVGHRVTSIDPIKANLPKIIVALVAVGAIGGTYTAYSAKQAADLAELEEIRKRVESEVVLGPTDYPWDQLTKLDDFLSLCQNNMEKAIVVIPGWELQPISCTVTKGVGSVTTGWERAGGSISWLRSGVSKDLPPVTMSPDGETASLSFAFEAPVSPDSWTEQPWDMAKSENWLMERFQNAGLELNIKPDQTNVASASATPVFNSHNIQITAGAGLSNYGDLVFDVPAMVPSALIYNVESLNWDLILKVYHPPLLPEPKK